jgi:hypothetical protein
MASRRTVQISTALLKACGARIQAVQTKATTPSSVKSSATSPLTVYFDPGEA